MTDRSPQSDRQKWPTLSVIPFPLHRKPENCVFSLKCCMLFHQQTRNTVKNITWSELNHPSLSKRSTGCTRLDQWREHSILLCVTHMLCVGHVYYAVSRCVKDGSCSSSSLEWNQWIVLMGYLTISTIKMLDAIKHITDDNSFSRVYRSTSYFRWHSKASFNCLLYR